MSPRRRGGWRRGQQQQVDSSFLYCPCSAVGERRGHMILHARLNRGGGRTLSVAAHSVGYGGGSKNGKLVQIVRKCNEYRR